MQLWRIRVEYSGNRYEWLELRAASEAEAVGYAQAIRPGATLSEISRRPVGR